MRKNSALFQLFFGFAISIFMLIFWIAAFNICNDDLSCLTYLAIPLFPGLLLGLTGVFSIFISLIFWFLIGALVGFVVYKIKNSK